VHSLIAGGTLAEQCSGQKSIGSKEKQPCSILARKILLKECGCVLSRGRKLWLGYKFTEANTGVYLSCPALCHNIQCNILDTEIYLVLCYITSITCASVCVSLSLLFCTASIDNVWVLML